MPKLLPKAPTKEADKKTAAFVKKSLTTLPSKDAPNDDDDDDDDDLFGEQGQKSESIWEFLKKTGIILIQLESRAYIQAPKI